jgi:DNA-binding transcriptional ArsR family regulator
MEDNQDDSFNASRAEVFEALGHPTRIRLLQCLSEKPLPFSELKRAAGLEGNGLLAFHLGKLGGLVRLNPEGAYALTDEGKEALRVIETSRTPNSGRSPSRPVLHLPRQNAVIAGLIVVLIVLGTVAIYQQEQITTLNHEAPSNVVTINGARYLYLSQSLQSVLGAKSLVFEGVNFTAGSPIYPVAAGTEVSFANATMYPAQNATSSGVHNFTFLPEITVKSGTGSIAYWNPFIVTIMGTPAGLSSGSPNVVNITFTSPPAGTWFSPQDHPAIGIGWDESTGIMTFYVSVS